MGLIYDNPDLAALTLTRLAAEESDGPGALEGRMRDHLAGLGQCNGTAYLELMAITLARCTSPTNTHTRPAKSKTPSTTNGKPASHPWKQWPA